MKAQSILIIGIAGSLAKSLAKNIIEQNPDCNIVGVDSRNVSHISLGPQLRSIQMSYSRNHFEKLFRDETFDVVYHLARMSHASTGFLQSLEERLDLNLMGTKRILDLSLKFNVKKVVILSTYHVYGALPDNPVLINEDFPLRASIRYPELRDVVEMDHIASNWMWKNQSHINTVILRPCNVIGPKMKNTMSRYLMTRYAPVCADFNPMFQFISEEDMARILEKSLSFKTGVYNVSPSDSISLKEAKKLIQSPTTPIPSFVLKGLVKLVSNSLWKFPNYLIDYIKYGCIIDNQLLLDELGDEKAFVHSSHEAVKKCQIS